MDHNEYNQPFKAVIKASVFGCDNLVELKSKCRHCLFNAGSFIKNEVICTKKAKKQDA